MRQSLCYYQRQQPSPFTRSTIPSFSSGLRCHLDRGRERWHSHGRLPALAEQRPTRTGRRLTARQGSGQFASSMRLPQRLHSSPGLNTTDGARRLWDRLIFNERDTEVQEVMERVLQAAQPGKELDGSLGKNLHCLLPARSLRRHWRWLCCNINSWYKGATGPSVFPLHLRALAGVSRLYCPSSRSPRG